MKIENVASKKKRTIRNKDEREEVYPCERIR